MIKKVVLFFYLVSTSLFGWSEPGASNKPQIAIVIDDLGYDLKAATWLAEQPFPLTMAVIPGTPHSKRILQSSQKQELILHVPMEPEAETEWEEGLTTAMTQKELQTRLTSMLEAHPSVVGINNHGGSRLTRDEERMGWVMQLLKAHDLFFLDSRTTNQSRAEFAASEASVDIGVRDVFLDHDANAEFIAEQFQNLRKIALEKGQAIAIGHPYPETLSALASELPLLVEEGFELTFCSKIIQKQTNLASK
jgi:polysaccharide deacetylase 2 family uncharacterized protein YibQ